MEEIDLKYIANTFANLCGMPCRIYENNLQVYFSSLTKFVKDPAILIESQLSKYHNSIGYIYDEDFFYYGYVNYQNKTLLLGPARIIKPDNSLLAKMILKLNISKEDSLEFIQSMNTLIPMPLESIILSLSSLNYILNHEKKNLNDIILNNDENVQKNKNNYQLKENDNTSEHNTYDIENKIMDLISNGDVIKLEEFIKNAPAVNGGVLSNDALRQMKNIFITTVTLASRAAIKGGEDINEALSISDLYIQKVEMLKQYHEISSLQVTMLLDYANRVAKIRGTYKASPFLIKINKYIESHISDAIKSKDITKNLYISKSVLFDKIKKETGLTLDNYILNYKIKEAKNLLKYSPHSILAISQYLGFSSQSHFNKVFKSLVGLTPKKYKIVKNNLIY